MVFIFFLFPETYGRSLEELAFLYEDDQKAEQSRRVVEHADDGPAVPMASNDDHEKGFVDRVESSIGGAK